ncbi:MAG: hypothetical protein WAO55_14540 [Candidatus Manganitrophaceae bacterium]
MNCCTFLLAFWIFPTVLIAADEEASLRPLHQLADEVYRLSQEMITHGSEGHADEIVGYGRDLIQRIEPLIQQVESHPSSKLKQKKKTIVASLKATLQAAEKAVDLGEQKKIGPALDAARKTSFRAKLSRQQLRAIR